MHQISSVTKEPTLLPVKAITVSSLNPEISSPSSTPSSSHAAQNNIRDYCVYKGRKYAINERIEDGCESICKCMASSASVECESRCPKHNQTTATRKQCVSVPDPEDPLCCRIELCDVTLDDHEQGAIAIVPAPPSLVDAMKHRNAPNSNRTSNELNLNNNNNNTRKELMSSVASAVSDANAAGDKHDPNEKYDCEHKGSKYKIGMTIKKHTNIYK